MDGEIYWTVTSFNNSEPPVGSMCVVAFTTSYWVRPGESLGRLAFNILWIGVIYGEKYVLHLFYL